MLDQKIQNLIYQEFTPLGCKDIIAKSFNDLSEIFLKLFEYINWV